MGITQADYDRIKAKIDEVNAEIAEVNKAHEDIARRLRSS